jgi:hypothetical protein
MASLAVSTHSDRDPSPVAGPWLPGAGGAWLLVPARILDRGSVLLLLGLMLFAGRGFAQTYGVFREYYAGIEGTSLSDFTDNAAFPNSPTSTNVITDYFDAPHDFADNYGTRLRAFILPPATGNHTFWVASDDSRSISPRGTSATPRCRAGRLPSRAARPLAARPTSSNSAIRSALGTLTCRCGCRISAGPTCGRKRA